MGGFHSRESPCRIQREDINSIGELLSETWLFFTIPDRDDRHLARVFLQRQNEAP